MAIPTFRSYQTIVSDMINTFLSRSGLKGIKVGGPLLTLFEAVGQGIFRNSQDLFVILDSQGLDRATGTTLDRQAETEKTQRLPATFATTNVDIGDSSFTQISSNIYLGAAAPTIGNSFVILLDASSFPDFGKVYIGRGTVNVEGPIDYNKDLVNTNQLNLTTNLTNYHNVNETVILSQHEVRTIPAGTIVRTAQDNGTPSRYTTLFASQIEDGETLTTGIGVVCTASGQSGNAAKTTIKEFDAPPFTGATVNNPNSVINGYPIENDDSLRERIRALRAGRSKGTDLALITAAQGVTSSDEHKTVVGASLVSTAPTTLYIDDGTGYEEINYGVAYESIISQALGGEQYAQLTTGTPIAVASLVSSLPAPFAIVSGSVLEVNVGGVISSITFSEDQFRSISNATTYEVVNAINENTGILFSARTVESGTKVAIFARSEANEDMEVLVPSGANANDFIGFPKNIHYTLRLYHDGRLLYKDGRKAIISSNPQISWLTFPATVTLTVAVDGTAPVTYTITGSDFNNAGTGYNSVSNVNSLASWAKVLNFKIPGILATATVAGIALTSNSGTSARANIDLSIAIGETTSLITYGMFNAVSASGIDSDYTLDRSTGQIKLSVPLTVGSSLTAGTVDTRGFVQSGYFGEVINPVGETIWATVDAAPIIIPHSISGQVTITNIAGNSYSVVLTTGTYPTDLQNGDWMIMVDPAFSVKRAVRIDNIAAANEVDVHGLDFINENIGVTNTGIIFVRTQSFVHKIVLDSIPVSLQGCADTINAQIVGANASVYNTNYVRITANRYGAGDITVLASTSGFMGFPLLETGLNSQSHLAAIESSNSQSGTPNFYNNPVILGNDTIPGSPNLILNANNSVYEIYGGEVLESRKRWAELATPECGNNLNRTFPVNLADPASTTCVVSESIEDEFIDGEAFLSTHPYAIGPDDSLRMTFDKSDLNKTVAIPMYRGIKGSGAYGASIGVVDTITSTQLKNVFGNTFDLSNFALYMNARVASHYGCGVDNIILWRNARQGVEGERTSVRYVNPTAPGQAINVIESAFNWGNDHLADIQVRLPSGDAIAIPGLTATTKFYVYTLNEVTPSGNGRYWYYQYAKNKIPVGGMVRTAGVVTVTPDLFPPPQADLGISAGDVVYITGGADVDYPAGPYTVSASTLTTFSYINGVGDTAPSTIIRWVSNAGLADPDFSNLVAGNIVYINPDIMPDTNAQANAGALRIYAITPNADGVFAFKVVRKAGFFDMGQTTGVPFSIRGTNNFTAYSITPTTATAIATAVNVPAFSSIVSATILGTGLGTVSIATNDEYNQEIVNYVGGALGTTNVYWPMFDGINFIYQANLVTDVIQLKKAITADLAAYGDWANEHLRLVPITAKNIVDFLNAPLLSNLPGLGQVAKISNGKVQIVTNTLGTSGAIKVLGGTANGAAATLIGTAVIQGSGLINGLSKLTVPASQIAGFTSDGWVKLQANYTTRKIIGLGGTSFTIDYYSAGGLWRVTSTAPIRSATTTAVNRDWNVFKHPPFAELVAFGPGVNFAANCGAWLIPVTANASPGNMGIKRVLAEIAGNTHWILSPDAVEEVFTISTMKKYNYDNMMPGDVFVVGSNVLGVNNVGRWTVASVLTDNSFLVYGNMTAIGPIAVPASEDNAFAIEEAEPLYFYKRIHSIIPSPTAGYFDIILKDSQLCEKLSSSAGYSVIAMDKLAFDTDLSEGLDAYSYSGGLLGEVNRVIYGDSSNPSIYPGYVAAGASIRISGPLVKRIQVTLNIRPKTNAPEQTLRDNVKNAVASIINNSVLGTPIAISKIVAAAQAVQGVAAVTISSPLYNSANDLIPVQANEKPRIIDIDQDITVNLLGA